MQKAFFFQSFCTPYRNCRFVSTAQRQDFHPASSMETENLNFKPFLPLKCMNKVEIIYTRIPLTTSILLTLHFFCFSTIPSLRFHNKKSHNMYVLHFVFLLILINFFRFCQYFLLNTLSKKHIPFQISPDNVHRPTHQIQFFCKRHLEQVSFF